MNVIFKTDQGKIRRHNEDSGGVFLKKTDSCLAIVADGMGGHNAGEVASSLATNALKAVWDTAEEFTVPEETERWLSEKVALANEKIFAHSQEHKECDGMGTTIVAAICTKNFASIVHVGDSRCYVLNENGFKQLTEDHSLVNELIKAGEITPEAAEFHPKRNMLLKAMGTEKETEMDITTITFEENDILLLCSDGLSNKVSSQEMEKILREERSLEEKAEQFIALANQYGGEDNISLAIVEAVVESRCQEC